MKNLSNLLRRSLLLTHLLVLGERWLKHSFAVSALGSGFLLVLWIWIHPERWVSGVGMFALLLIYVAAADYAKGLFDVPARRQAYLRLASIPLAGVLIFYPLPPVGYVLAFVALLLVCLQARKRARRSFLLADFKAKAQLMPGLS